MSKSIPDVCPRAAKNQRAASTPTSASSSSSVMNSPERFDIETSTPSRTNRTQAMRIICDASRVVAHRRGRVAEPGHRPVVVRAPDVDEAVEAAAELLDDIADVGAEVRPLAVRLANHPVLVVAEGGGSEPERAVVLVQRAGRLAGARSPGRPSHRGRASPRSSRRRSGRRDGPATPRSPPGPAPTPTGPRSPPGRRPRPARRSTTSSGISWAQVADVGAPVRLLRQAARHA